MTTAHQAAPDDWVHRAIGAAGVIAWRWNRTTRKVDVTGGEIRPEGTDPDELMKAVHPDDLSGLRMRWNAAVQAGEPVTAEFRLATHEGGETRWLFIHAVPSGEAYTGVAYDITDRKRAEHDFLTQERLYRRIVQSVAEAVCILDPDGRISWANEPAAKLTGFPFETIIGTSIFEAVFPNDLAEANARFERRKTGAADRYEVPIRRSDGSALCVEVASAPMYDDCGRFSGSLLLATDITERKNAEAELGRQREALERSNADLQQFAYVTSHDLQEPLRTINTYTQLIQSRYGAALDTDAQEFMEFISGSAFRMQALIQDLLTYSRVVTPDTAPPGPVDLTGVVQWALMNLQHAVRETGAAVRYDDLPTVYGDRTRLTQLFQNLIGNALKYRGEAPPAIGITAQRDNGDYWRISIRDNGIGIAPEYHERIFGLFKRLHGPEYSGSGLGLAICRKIVEQHGGRIWIESSPGNGATFHFTVPS